MSLCSLIAGLLLTNKKKGKIIMGVYMVFAVVAVPCMVFIIYAFTPKGKRWRREQGLL